MNRLKAVRIGAAAVVLLTAAVCWASKGSIAVTLPNITKSGGIATTGTKTTFNYVLTNGSFTGSASAKVKNASGREVKFKNGVTYKGVTIKSSLYDVKANGAATFTASGTVR